MAAATAIKDRLKELNTALQAKAAELEQISAAFKIEGNNVEVSTEQRDAYVKAVNAAEKIKQDIMTEEKAYGVFEFLGKPEQGVPAAAADAANTARPTIMGAKALSEMFLESEAFQEMKASGFRNFGQVATFERGIGTFQQALQLKDIYSAMAGNITLPALGSQTDLGLTPRMIRPGRVRDLFPSETTTSNLLYGIREVGFTNRAAVVPERRAADGVSAPTGGPTDVYGLKPRSDLQIVPVTYPIATIAHIMYVHRNTLADEPRMRGLIDRDMIDGVKLVEDAQILYGDGIGDNLTGLFNTPGVQTYTGDSADPRTAQIRRAITRVMLAYYVPSGVVMHPLDWEDLELERDDTGAYRLAVNVAVGGEKRLWRLPVVDTPVIQEGKFVMGAFGTGAKIYDREQVNIQVSTENRDMFERNAVTVRCEERLGLVVDRPESFLIGTLTTPA
ncbi:phage major capsid protein [Microbispora sp. NPDC049125]|uniref:phage major capsid protein n=1 Tax=Microbispora sp. NPDC049125 TaxID=3154929 RepID=UPI003467E9AB